MSNAVTRRQEFEADRASVRAAGVPAATSAMREIPVVAAAWNFYFGRYVSYGWELGYAPDDVFGGFARLYAARSAELDEMREGQPDRATSRWDTHPSTAERIAAMRAASPGEHPADDRPAGDLLPGLAEASLALQREVVDVGSREVLSWPDFTAAAMTTMLQNRADRVFRAVAGDPGRRPRPARRARRAGGLRAGGRDAGDRGRRRGARGRDTVEAVLKQVGERAAVGQA
ncbi:M48 family metalloprotease [Mangrovihabitans endophyticus]|uniref:M48 family metalloprotease n=1 Tax=Mangrovihabitans endophyticus TaxID=1751298 RepID=UPI001666B83B|nr:M48 family metalloprotease [Mangrovihabitans endophyticus]